MYWEKQNLVIALTKNIKTGYANKYVFNNQEKRSAAGGLPLSMYMKLYRTPEANQAPEQQWTHAHKCLSVQDSVCEQRGISNFTSWPSFAVVS